MQREFPVAPIVGVGAVVLDGERVLLVRRGHEPLKGEWSLPGGALELGETLESGACREVAEETGLEVRVVGIVEVLDRIIFEPSEDEEGMGRVRYHYVLIDYLCEVTGGVAEAASDATDVRWVERQDLNARGAYRLAPESVEVIEKAFRMARGPESIAPVAPDPGALIASP